MRILEFLAVRKLRDEQARELSKFHGGPGSMGGAGSEMLNPSSNGKEAGTEAGKQAGPTPSQPSSSDARGSEKKIPLRSNQAELLLYGPPGVGKTSLGTNCVVVAVL